MAFFPTLQSDEMGSPCGFRLGHHDRHAFGVSESHCATPRRCACHEIETNDSTKNKELKETRHEIEWPTKRIEHDLEAREIVGNDQKPLPMLPYGRGIEHSSF